MHTYPHAIRKLIEILMEPGGPIATQKLLSVRAIFLKQPQYTV